MDTIQANNKRIAKNTLLLYIRMIFTMLVSLYTSRVVLNTLGVDDFGIYNVVGGFVIMFTFINNAMSSSTQRYLNFELGSGNFSKLQNIFSTSVNIHIIISAIIIILAETIGLWFLYNHMTIPQERFEAALWVYQFAIMSTVVMVISVPYNAAIIAHEKMSTFAYISVIEVILKLLIVYLLSIFNFDKLKFYAVLMFCIQLIIRFIYGRYCNKHFEETRYKRIWDVKLLKEMSSFAGWSLFGNLSSVLSTQGVNVLLNMFFGPIVNAARGIAVQIQQAINGFVLNFQTAINPQITKNYALGNIKYLHNLIFTSAKFSILLLLILSLPIFIETEQILQLWLKTVPTHTANFTRIILCIAIIDCTANALSIGAQATGKIKRYQITIGFIILLIVPVSYLTLKIKAVPEFVLYVHLGIAVIAQTGRIIFMKKLIQLPIKSFISKVYLPFLKVLTTSAIIPGIIYHIIPPSLNRLIIISLISVTATGISIYLLGLNNNEKKFLKTSISNILLKLKKK